MIAIDTNVLIRLLTDDDPAQCAKARKVMTHDSVFIPETVLLECSWVLLGSYQFRRQQVFDGLTRLLGLRNVSVNRPFAVHEALGWFQDGMDFADALHLAGCSHCKKLVTFDRGFIKSAKRRASCAVTQP